MPIDPSKVQWDDDAIDPSKVQWDDAPASPNTGGFLSGLMSGVTDASRLAVGQPLSNATPVGAGLNDVPRGAARGAVHGLGDLAKYTVGLPALGLATIGERAYNMLPGDDTHALTDWVAGNVVRPLDTYPESVDQALPYQTPVGPVAQQATEVGTTLASALLGNETGAATKLTKPTLDLGEYLLNAGKNTLRTSAIPAEVSAGKQTQDVLNRGGTLPQAFASGAAAGLATPLEFAMPLSVEGGLLKRMLSGGAVSPVLTQFDQAARNAPLPDDLKQELSPGDYGRSAMLDTAMAALLGPRAAGVSRAKADPVREVRTAAKKAGFTDADIEAAEAPAAEQRSALTPDMQQTRSELEALMAGDELPASKTEDAKETLVQGQQPQTPSPMVTDESVRPAESEPLESQSPIKSVQANIRRGREAMARALTEKADQHRAMYRPGMGWVDFVWGSAGGEPVANGRHLKGKGLAHLIDQRMRNDGLSIDEAEQVAQRMVSVIASGREVARTDVDGNVNVRLDHDGYQAALVRQKGSNSWILTGFKKKTPGDAGAIGHAPTPTREQPTGNRLDAGAGVDESLPRPAPDGNEPRDFRDHPDGEVREEDLTPEERAWVARVREDSAKAGREAEADAAERELDEQMRQENAAQGEREADQRGMKRVADAMFPDQQVTFVHDEDGVDPAVRGRLRPLKRGQVRKGFYDPKTGRTYILTKHTRTPGEAAWTVAHEVGGHKAFRSWIDKHADTKVGGRTAREALHAATELARQNATVSRLADVIKRGRGETRRGVDVEEALAELQAASLTGDFDRIQSRYGVEVPEAMRPSLKRSLANYVRRITRILNAIFKRETGHDGTFTDEDVRDMLAHTLTALDGRSNRFEKAPRGPLDSSSPGRFGARDEPLNSDEPAPEAGADAAHLADARRAWEEEGTESPYFKKWFGDSKVVDSDGKPLVVYHGAPDARFVDDDGTFKTMGERYGKSEPGKRAFWFSDRATAHSYADDRRAFDYQNAEPGIIGAYLKLENPLIIDARGKEWRDAQARGKTRDVIDQAREGGHDGIIIRNVKDNYNNGPRTRPADTYTVFDSRQIKSSDRNRGTFDADNPDIRYIRNDSVRRPRAPKDVSGRSLSVQDVKGVALRVLKVDPERAGVHVVSGFDGLSPALRKALAQEGAKSGDFDAFHWRGKSYLLADMMHSKADVQKAIFHEHYTHGGLRTKYRNRLGDKLDELLKGVGGRDGVMRMAREQDISLKPYETALDKDTRFTDRQKNLVLMEELLAHMSHATGTLRRVIQEWHGAFRDWARRVGFSELADLNVSDLAHVLKRARLAAREAVNHASDRPMLHRVSDEAEHERAGDGELDSAGPTNANQFDEPFPIKHGKLDNARFQLQDKFIDLQRIQEGVEASTRRVLDDAENVKQAAELFTSKAAAQIEDFRENVEKPIVDFMHKGDLDVREVDDWLMARHAAERNRRMQEINPGVKTGSGMSDAKANAVLAKYRNNETMQRIGKIVDWMVSKNRQMMMGSGLVPADAVAAWSKMYEHYVPLKGFDDAEKGPNRVQPSGRGFDVRGKVKQAFGRDSRAASPLANLLADYERTIVQANKAEVGRTLYRLAQSNPNGALWELNKVPQTPRIDKRTGLVAYGPDPMYKFADNVINVKIDGADHTITMHGERGERFAKAFKNLSTEMQSGVIRGLSRVNRYLAAVNTSLNPEFMLSNFLRDVQEAFVNMAGTEVAAMRTKVVRDIPKAMKGLREVLRKGEASGEWAKYTKDFRQDGGMTMWMDAHHDVDKLARSLSGQLRGLKRGKLHPANVFSTTGKLIEDYNKIVENGVRLSAYVHARKAGLSRAKAAHLAKDLTVNFDRKGQLGPVINAMYLFYNASIQGNARVLRALKNPKVRKTVYGIIAASAAMSVANRMVGGTDEDGIPYYDKIPDHEKESNLIFMLPPDVDLPDWMESRQGGGKYLKIILPYGYNVFKVFGDKVGDGLSAALGYKKKFEPMQGAMATMDAFIGSFNPLGSSPFEVPAQAVSPSLLDPAVQVWTNKTWYGAPMYPAENPFDRAPKPDSQLYWNSTSQASRKLASLLNAGSGGDSVVPGRVDVSPITLDLLWNTLTGGTGATALRGTKVVGKAITGEDLEPREVPFVRRAVGAVNARQFDREQFYDNLTRIAQAKKELDTAITPAQRKRRVDEWGGYLRMRPMARGSERELRALRKQKDRIDAMSLSAREKSERKEAIDKRMGAVYLRLNMALEKALEAKQ